MKSFAVEPDPSPRTPLGGRSAAAARAAVFFASSPVIGRRLSRIAEGRLGTFPSCAPRHRRRRTSEAELAPWIDEDDAAGRAHAIREVLDGESRGLLGRGAAADLLDGRLREARAKNPFALP